MTELSENPSEPDRPIPAPTIEEVRAEVLRLDPQLSEDSSTFQAAVVLLSALIVGQDAYELAGFTGYERDFISVIAQRMKKSALWVNGNFHCNWMDEKTGEVAFWCDVLVAKGRASFSPSDERSLSMNQSAPFESA